MTSEPAPAGGQSAAPSSADAQSLLFSPDELESPGGMDAGPFEAMSEQEAPFQDRVLGGLADLTILLAVLGVGVISAQWMGVRVGGGNWAPFLIFALLFSFPYAVIPLAFWGQTPGMAWVGHVARSHDGEPLMFDQTARRWLGSLLTLALAGLPLLLALRGGSLADRLSDSRTMMSRRSAGPQ